MSDNNWLFSDETWGIILKLGIPCTTFFATAWMMTAYITGVQQEGQTARLAERIATFTPEQSTAFESFQQRLAAEQNAITAQQNALNSQYQYSAAESQRQGVDAQNALATKIQSMSYQQLEAYRGGLRTSPSK